MSTLSSPSTSSRLSTLKAVEGSEHTIEHVEQDELKAVDHVQQDELVEQAKHDEGG